MFYIAVGLAGGAVAGLLGAFPKELVIGIAGLALLGTIGGGLASALQQERHRDAALLTYVVTLSGLSIAGIGSAIGAAYGGSLAVTTTSGPGVALKSEAIGLAVALELPLIIVDVQRGGPATGLPTKTEQSDLLAAITPGHGDMSVPVIAPGDPEEAFWAAAKALNWAERYQGPVILLTESSIAERVAVGASIRVSDAKRGVARISSSACSRSGRSGQPGPGSCASIAG